MAEKMLDLEDLVSWTVVTSDDIRRILPEQAEMIGWVRFTLEFGKLGGKRWGAEFEFRPYPNADTMVFQSTVSRSTPKKALKTLLYETRRACANSKKYERKHLH